MVHLDFLVLFNFIGLNSIIVVSYSLTGMIESSAPSDLRPHNTFWIILVGD